MGASFEDLVETNLLEKQILNQSCHLRDKTFWIFELEEIFADTYFLS
jgi:hypothetical protein